MSMHGDYHWLRRLGQRGATLVELLLVMGLLSIFLVLLTGIFTAALDVRNQSQSNATVVQDGRFIVARLQYDIARASAVTSPASLGATSNTLTVTVDGVAYTYTLNGTNLQLTDGIGADTLNGADTTISALTFTRLGNAGGDDTIRLSFTVTSKIFRAGVADSQTFTTTAGLR